MDVLLELGYAVVHTLVHDLPHLAQAHLLGEVLEVKGTAHVVALSANLFVAHIVIVTEAVAFFANEERANNRRERDENEHGVDGKNQCTCGADIDKHPNHTCNVVHNGISAAGCFIRRFDIGVKKRGVLVAGKVDLDRLFLHNALKITVDSVVFDVEIACREVLKEHFQDAKRDHAPKRYQNAIQRNALLQCVECVHIKISTRQKGTDRAHDCSDQVENKHPGAGFDQKPEHIDVVLKRPPPVDLLFFLFFCCLLFRFSFFHCVVSPLVLMMRVLVYIVWKNAKRFAVFCKLWRIFFFFLFRLILKV